MTEERGKIASVSERVSHAVPTGYIRLHRHANAPGPAGAFGRQALRLDDADATEDAAGNRRNDYGDDQELKKAETTSSIGGSTDPSSLICTQNSFRCAGIHNYLDFKEI